MAKLGPVQQKFVLHWGEMGTRWGINRTVAQIHALLYLSPKPLHAEEIADTLGVARSNVSTSLKELQGWGIVKLSHVLDERKKREIDPTLNMLRGCIAETGTVKDTDNYTVQRLRDLADFFETTTAWYGQIRSWPASALAKFVKLG